KGDLLLFVDDDNVLKEDYIEHALIKMQNMAWLGAIGGAILPEYEATPPSWFLPYERMLAIRRPTVAKWSNSLTDWESQPWGAGLVMRRKVCEQYLEDVENDVLKKGLGRSGDSLMSGEDVDMVFSCTKLGLGFGVFPDLVVLHLIPKNRLNE